MTSLCSQSWLLVELELEPRVLFLVCSVCPLSLGQGWARNLQTAELLQKDAVIMKVTVTVYRLHGGKESTC